MSLLEMSISGAVMILAIAVIRAVALHKLPKRTFLILWAIAVARLLLPYSLPSAMSVYSLWATVSSWTNPPKPQSGIRVYRVAGGANVLPGTALTVNSPVAESAAAVDPWFVVWLVVAVICAAAVIESYARCRREFRASLPVDCEFVERWLGEQKLRRKLSVRQSDRVSTPLTYGVLRPVILLPKNIDLEDEETMRYVLTHELVHIRRFDAVSKLLLVAAVCVHWFNPLVWVMYVLANRDIEISCDEAVIRAFGGESKACYARALIRMEERRSGPTAFYNGFSKNAIEERIVSIMKIRKTSAVAVLMAAALIAGTGAALATSAAEPKPEPSPKTQWWTFNDDGEVTNVVSAQTPKVEWWTYEGYKEWLENEKVELQSMLGEKGWTSGRGDFVWTQEIIDETIAMYEKILEDIKNGYLVSKTVDGSEDTMLMMNPGDVLSGAGEARFGNEIPPIDEYEPFGVTLNEQENALYYNGEKIRWFEDNVAVGDGVSSRCNYYRADGTVSLRTVRESVRNDDGSTDPFGPIVRLETIPSEEADKIIAAQIAFGQSMVNITVIEDKDGMVTTNGFMLPIEPDSGLVMSRGFSDEHKGVDIVAPKGTPVCSVAAGIVTEVGYNKQLGNFVKIEHDGGCATTYGHLASVSVKKGDVVDMVSVVQIGEVGATGSATGPNLHFELSLNGTPIDPEEFYGLSASLESGAFSLDAYEPFGLDWKCGMDGTLTMSWQGKPVHSLFDPQTAAWFANSLRGSNLGEEAVDLEAVYENGKLVGLKEVESQDYLYGLELVPGDGTAEVVIKQVTVTTSDDGVDEGTPLPNMFDKYAPYGITYEEKQTPDGMERNLYLNGKHVNHFADTDPNGGAFTFSSSTQSADGITVHAVYENGKLAGVWEVCDLPQV